MDLFEWAEQANATMVSDVRSRPDIRNEDGKRRTMLERLANGPLSTFDAERLVHRGQAVIGALRSDGHQINLEKRDGVDHYVLRGKVVVVKVTPTLQNQYYATEHWKEISAERKRHDGYTCQQCGCSDELETHHWRYRLFSEDMLHDLITLCRPCHQAIHEACKGSWSVHFPRQVSEDIANRIEDEHAEYVESDF